MFSFRSIDLDKDRETIIKFRRDSYKISFSDEGMFGDNENYIRKIEDRILNYPDGLVIVEKAGVPVGQIEMQIKLYENNKIGYVNLFYLISGYRDKGYGIALINYAENFFRKYEVNEYQLRVSTTNLRAINFYQKHGFNLLRIEDEDTVPRYRMHKILATS